MLFSLKLSLIGLWWEKLVWWLLHLFDFPTFWLTELALEEDEGSSACLEKPFFGQQKSNPKLYCNPSYTSDLAAGFFAALKPSSKLLFQILFKSHLAPKQLWWQLPQTRGAALKAGNWKPPRRPLTPVELGSSGVLCFTVNFKSLQISSQSSSCNKMSWSPLFWQ